MGRVIAVANQKGGVGKTTTAINLASSFAAAEVNTLLVDCDPQSNATSGVGLVKDPERISTYHLLMGAASLDEALQKTELEQLWIVPSHKNLIGANLELIDAERREFRLRDALAEARSHGKPALVYDVRSRGAESYIQLAKEIIERSMPGVQWTEPAVEEPAATEVEEKQVVNAPRWKRWMRERGRLTTINISDR